MIPNLENWDKTLIGNLKPRQLPNLRELQLKAIPKSVDATHIIHESAESEKTQYFGSASLQITYPHAEEMNRQHLLETPFNTFAKNIKQENYQNKVFYEGNRIGKYTINRAIGEGNFSKIYEASHIYLRNSVAIKTLYNPQGINSDIFLREAQSLAIISHENVVKVFDADIFDGIPCIILEHLEGKTLQDELRVYQNLTVDRALDLLEQLGSVLIKQEEKEILHLDIKPANVFIRSNGSFCLFDYGLVGINESKATNKKPVVGTPAYMPPEQWIGQADNRSDLFSLGMTAWECFVGKQARTFTENSDYYEISKMQIELLTALNPNFPTELSEIITHLTAIHPKDRYQTAKDFVEDLNRFRYNLKSPWGPTNGTAFIAIPFSKEFNPVFDTISIAAKRANLKARRLDQHIFFGKDIWSQCVQELEIAKVVIADFSAMNLDKFPNPNVITEAAHARAIKKNLIIIKQGKPDDMPFDWRFTPVIPYENSDDGLKKLEIELLSKLKKALDE